MTGADFEVGVAYGQPSGAYHAEVMAAPKDGEIAEGVIEITPAILIGSGIARAMALTGYDPQGATFEHAVTDANGEVAAVVVTTAVEREPSDIAGYDTGHETTRTSARIRWHKAVRNLVAYLNEDEPTVD